MHPAFVCRSSLRHFLSLSLLSRWRKGINWANSFRSLLGESLQGPRPPSHSCTTTTVHCYQDKSISSSHDYSFPKSIATTTSTSTWTGELTYTYINPIIHSARVPFSSSAKPFFLALQSSPHQQTTASVSFPASLRTEQRWFRGAVRE